MHDLDDAPRCTSCRTLLYADELGRQACRPCTHRADGHLAALAGPDGLYARLSGTVHGVTLDTAGARRPGYRTRYGHTVARGLPLAARSSA